MHIGPTVNVLRNGESRQTTNGTKPREEQLSRSFHCHCWLFCTNLHESRNKHVPVLIVVLVAAVALLLHLLPPSVGPPPGLQLEFHRFFMTNNKQDNWNRRHRVHEKTHLPHRTDTHPWIRAEKELLCVLHLSLPLDKKLLSFSIDVCLSVHTLVLAEKPKKFNSKSRVDESIMNGTKVVRIDPNS